MVFLFASWEVGVNDVDLELDNLIGWLEHTMVQIYIYIYAFIHIMYTCIYTYVYILIYTYI